MTSIRLAALCACVLTPIFTYSAALAQDQPEKSDLAALVCKDIMRLAGEDRAIALAALHGYMLAKKGETQYVASELARISDEFTEYCLDHPQDKALEAFAKFRQ